MDTISFKNFLNDLERRAKNKKLINSEQINYNYQPINTSWTKYKGNLMYINSLKYF